MSPSLPPFRCSEGLEAQARQICRRSPALPRIPSSCTVPTGDSAARALSEGVNGKLSALLVLLVPWLPAHLAPVACVS